MKASLPLTYGARKTGKNLSIELLFNENSADKGNAQGCDGVLARLIRPSENANPRNVLPDSLLVGFVSKHTTRNVCYITWHRDEKAIVTVETYIIIIANTSSLSSASMEQGATHIKAFW